MRRWRLLSTGFVAGKGEGGVLEEGEAGVEMLVSMYPHAVEELPSDDVVGGAECEASGPEGEGSREAEFAPTGDNRAPTEGSREAEFAPTGDDGNSEVMDDGE